MLFILAAIASVTFFNPNISILDILPDVIGCLIMVSLLRKPADLSSHAADARSMFIKLSFVMAAKTAIMILVKGDDKVMLLVFSLCFGIAEALMYYNAFSRLIDGYSYLAQRFDEPAAFAFPSSKELEKYNRKKARYDALCAKKIERFNENEAHRREGFASRKPGAPLPPPREFRSPKPPRAPIDGATKLSRVTRVFFIIRAAATILPEMSVLSSYEYSGDVKSGLNFNIAEFRGLLLGFGCIISLVAGIIWLKTALRYFKAIFKNSSFTSKLSAAYDEMRTTRGGIYVFRRLRFSLLLLGIGCVLSINFAINNIDIVPNFISPLFFIAFFIIAKNELGSPKKGIIVASISTAISLAQWIYMFVFTNKHDIARALMEPKVYPYYIIACVITVIDSAFFIYILYYTTKRLLILAEHHTGTLELSLAETVARFKRGCRRFFDFGVFTALMSTLYVIFCVITKEAVTQVDGVKYVIYIPVFESVGMVTFGISILFAIYSAKLFADLSDSIKLRYEL